MPAGSLLLSVVVCTFNRAAALEQCLRSLANQSGSAQPFETIVVNNGSIDCTPIVDAARASLPNLHYAVEPRLGLSRARNRGLALARGDLVAYLDDDATADPVWVERIRNVWCQDPGTAAAGGPIHVRWPGEKPHWMPPSLEGYFGACDYGPERRVLEFPQYPFGSNMVFRRDVLLELGGFDERLGAKGRMMIAAEETDIFQRLAQRRATVVYEPAAVVQHWPPAERVTRSWSLNRAFLHGVSSSLLVQSLAEGERLVWARRVVGGATKAVIGATSALLSVLTGRESRVTISRIANSLYWTGVVVGTGAPARLWRPATPP